MSFSVAGRSYTVDVGKMEQMNTATGVRRKVARRAPKGNITLQPKVTPPFIPSPLSPSPWDCVNVCGVFLAPSGLGLLKALVGITHTASTQALKTLG